MPVSIKEEEQLSETVKEFPVLYEKATKGYKEKDAGKAATRGVLRNFTKFTGKHMCQSLFFNKVARLTSQACNFIKKETLVRRVLEGDAYFNVDTQRCDAYSRAVLI